MSLVIARPYLHLQKKYVRVAFSLIDIRFAVKLIAILNINVLMSVSTERYTNQLVISKPKLIPIISFGGFKKINLKKHFNVYIRSEAYGKW